MIKIFNIFSWIFLGGYNIVSYKGNDVFDYTKPYQESSPGSAIEAYYYAHNPVPQIDPNYFNNATKFGNITIWGTAAPSTIWGGSSSYRPGYHNERMVSNLSGQ